MVKRQERITAEEENRKREANRKRETKRIEEDRDREIIRQQEREILEEKLQAGLNLRGKNWKWRRRQEQLKLSFPS